MKMLQDTGALTREIEEVLFRPHRRDTPTWPLFHYTDANGFKGIVESKEIWATHFDYLNDSSELRHGEKIVRDEAEAALVRVPEGSAGHRFLRAAKMFLKYQGYDEEKLVRASAAPYRGGKG